MVKVKSWKLTMAKKLAMGRFRVKREKNLKIPNLFIKSRKWTNFCIDLPGLWSNIVDLEFLSTMNVRLCYSNNCNTHCVKDGNIQYNGQT